ncbi:hypothetical protein [Variovorax sp. EBFNA2]|uniref:hypothetical protein n=1 Tax=Variovorax sp. EBFNA2 TaxID=3342097 RepID=UPI0029C01955|nr:hypothetical protein [Variovorax boronicumulans]WPG35146.1 hypothetical protein RZE79_16775 [Variovorax boronicumulans]
MTQAAKKVDMRSAMPKTASMVDMRRAEWGKEYVHAMIKRGVAGEPNCFYAAEAGHTLGTPFAGPIAEDVAWHMVTFGVDAMCFFQAPKATDGTH